ncbi:MAG: energy transducer TonB [Prevotella sp.]|nr:energy transducer TonB [Prevotella sp.]
MAQCVAGIKGTIVAFEETGKESRVWLLAGSVEVKSKKTGKVTTLKPGQRSVTGTNGVVQVKSFNIKEGARKFGISMDDIRNHYSNSNAPTAVAQTGNAPAAAQTDNTIYDVVPTMPEFPGGAQAMSDYIAKNLKYPADAKQQGKDGFVMIQFVVEKDGSRSDVKVMRNGKLPSMDKEALRVVNSMPKFSPGRNEKNQPVRVKFTVPVRFKLN